MRKPLFRFRQYACGLDNLYNVHVLVNTSLMYDSTVHPGCPAQNLDIWGIRIGESDT